MKKAERFHFIGICGRAMGAIALALTRAGHHVGGSDQGTYGSMRERLRLAHVHVATPYSKDNLPAEPAVVVVGKRVAGDNPELLAAIGRGLTLASFPQLLRDRFLSHSRNAVVAGGVGKTTTTAMLAWILESAGLRPDYLIGGAAGNFPESARFDGGTVAALEGDEYASCFDDPTPKFLHYLPEVAVVTNTLEDHPDLYRDAAALQGAFRSLVRLLPARGCLVVSSEDEAAATLASLAACRAVSVGIGGAPDLPITGLGLDPAGSAFCLGGAAFRLRMCGRMNVRNAAMAAAAAAHFGVAFAQSARALASFTGVDDRQQGWSAGPCTIVMDKASHPESLRELSQALRQRYPGRRLVSVIQPRATGGRRWIYQRDLPAALAHYDVVVLLDAYEHAPPAHTAWQQDPFSVAALEGELRARAVEVVTVPELRLLPAAVCDLVREGDVVVMALREQHVAQVAEVEKALITRHRASAAL